MQHYGIFQQLYFQELYLTELLHYLIHDYFVFLCLEWLHFLKMTANVMPVTFVGGIKTALISFIEEFPDIACVSETKTQCISLILLDN